MSLLPQRKIIKDLLEMYKDSPCLWDTSSPIYRCKESKERAYTVLLDKYRMLVPNANTNTLKKKIEMLRASYRREVKKTLLYKHHKPSLWYFPYMKFLDVHTSSALVQSHRGSDDDDNDESEDVVPHSRSVASANKTENTSQLYNLLTNKHHIKKVVTSTRKRTPSQPTPKKKKTDALLMACTSSGVLEDSGAPEVPEYSTETEVITFAPESETSSFGNTVSLQLNELSTLQKTIAGKLISDVIFHGRLDQLTTETSMINLKD